MKKIIAIIATLLCSVASLSFADTYKTAIRTGIYKFPTESMKKKNTLYIYIEKNVKLDVVEETQDGWLKVNHKWESGTPLIGYVKAKNTIPLDMTKKLIDTATKEPAKNSALPTLQKDALPEAAKIIVPVSQESAPVTMTLVQPEDAIANHDKLLANCQKEIQSSKDQALEKKTLLDKVQEENDRYRQQITELEMNLEKADATIANLKIIYGEAKTDIEKLKVEAGSDLSVALSKAKTKITLKGLGPIEYIPLKNDYLFIVPLRQLKQSIEYFARVKPIIYSGETHSYLVCDKKYLSPTKSE